MKGVIPQWKYSAGESITTQAVPSGNRIFFGTVNGKLVALDRNSGGLLWEFAVPGGVHSAPAVHEGMVFFGSDGGTLFALTPTGRV